MEELIQDLNQIKGIKNTKRRGKNLLKMKLFSRKIKGSEAFKIKGDLRKISQKIRSKLEEAKDKKVIQKWNWVEKPEKKYTETQLGRGKATDRKEKGHKPNHYTVEIVK